MKGGGVRVQVCPSQRLIIEGIFNYCSQRVSTDVTQILCHQCTTEMLPTVSLPHPPNPACSSRDSNWCSERAVIRRDDVIGVWLYDVHSARGTPDYRSVAPARDASTATDTDGNWQRVYVWPQYLLSVHYQPPGYIRHPPTLFTPLDLRLTARVLTKCICGIGVLYGR